MTAYPYNPILVDMDRFEADLCTYLNAHALGEFKDPGKITDRWATDKSIGHISLLLATLAAGAHYSDVEYPRRLELATDFGNTERPERKLLLTASSPQVISCSPSRKFSLPTFPGCHPSAFNSRQHIAEYGAVRRCMGVTRYDSSTGSNDGASY